MPFEPEMLASLLSKKNLGQKFPLVVGTHPR